MTPPEPPDAPAMPAGSAETTHGSELPARSNVSAAPPPADPARLLRGLLRLIVGGLLAGCLVLLARLELVRWGFPLQDTGHPVVCRAFVFHVALALAALAGLWLSRVPKGQKVPDAGPRRVLWQRRACRALIALVPVLALVSVDLLLSVEYPPPPYGERSIFMRDSRLIWRLRPGATGTRGEHPVEINAHGLRGPEVPYEKPAGEFRVLFVGDSTTLGYGVAWEETFVARTQELLPRVGDRPVSVINAGIDGYTTWQELGWLEDEGFRYAPDVVVLGFCPNDLTDYEWPFIVYAGGRWLRHSGIFRAVQHWRHGPRGIWVRGRQRDFTPPLILDLFSAEESEPVRKGWNESLKDIETMQALCADRKIRFTLLYIPAQAQVLDPARFDNRPQRKLSDFAARQGILFLDPLPAMLACGPEGAVACYLDNWHLSAQGHALVAGRVAEWLKSTQAPE